MNNWNGIADHISQATGSEFRVDNELSVGGGCINTAQLLEGRDGRRWFVKFNRAELLPMFEAEADGLEAMVATGTVRVPKPLCHGISDGQAYLVMEAITSGQGGQATTTLGTQLAQMHRCTQEQFGWRRDNTIGSTPQPNALSDDWTRFWREQRLGLQLELAARNGYRGELQRKGAQLMAALDGILDGHRPLPSLLHGDLWSGNYSVDDQGRPVIFDPATYYGDREADLAMTELFGGFGAEFYRAYRQEWPLDDGYPRRRTLYNLYHILNHLNLFGGGYAGQAEQMMDSLLA
jgi:fructosamine-3-kinase